MGNIKLSCYKIYEPLSGFKYSHVAEIKGIVYVIFVQSIDCHNHNFSLPLTTTVQAGIFFQGGKVA